MFRHGERYMAYEPLTKEQRKKIDKDIKAGTVIEADFHQVTELGEVTVVMSSHVQEEKFTLIDYVDVYAKEKTKEIDYSVDACEELVNRGIDTNGFMIIVDITKDKKIASVEIIRM